MQARVEVNKRQVLALFGCEGFCGSTHVGHPIQLFVRASNEEEAGMNVRYRVELSQTERAELTTLLSGGKQAARKLKRAQILLAADAGASARLIPDSEMQSLTQDRTQMQSVSVRLNLHLGRAAGVGVQHHKIPQQSGHRAVGW